MAVVLLTLPARPMAENKKPASALPLRVCLNVGTVMDE
jgi:hypothetical protein